MGGIESTVDKLDLSINEMKNTLDNIYRMSEAQLRLLSKSLTNCEDLKTYGISESGRFYINHDQTQPPFEVFCHFNSDGSVDTVLKNSNDNIHEFEPCQELGCSQMTPEYKATEEQIKALVSASTYCEQSITLDCLKSPLKTITVKKAWWTGFDGNK